MCCLQHMDVLPALISLNHTMFAALQEHYALFMAVYVSRLACHLSNTYKEALHRAMSSRQCSHY